MDFDRWFNQQGRVPKVVEPVVEEDDNDGLPEGLYLLQGKVFATCRSCDNDYEYHGERDGSDFDERMSYCGGSERCIP